MNHLLVHVYIYFYTVTYCRLLKDTTVVHIVPACVTLIRVRDLQVDQRNCLFITDAPLQVELHERQHLCTQGDTLHYHYKHKGGRVWQIPHAMCWCVTDHMTRLSR